MKKRLLFLSTLVAFTLVGCSQSNGNTSETSNVISTSNTVTTTADEKFEVSFVDYLGKKETKEFNVSDYTTVLSALEELCDVESADSQYGTSIYGINNSFSDGNWAIMIYENGAAAPTGIDGLHIDAGDKFEFRHECWNTTKSGYGTFDEYDVLVDKAIYNYVNNKFKTTLKETTTWSGSTYWEDMALYKLINAEGAYGKLYDQSLFNADLLNTDLKSSIASADISKITGTDLFKYYYAARLVKDDFTEFKNTYSSYIESFTQYADFGEYTIPFVTSTAKTLGLLDKLSDDVKNTTYRADSSQWGPDGLSWQLTGMASLGDIPSTDLAEIDFAKLENSYSKDVSLSSMILPYAASNKSVRTLKNDKSEDVIKYLFDNYFDEATMKFTTETSDSDYSSNQIYAALVAYKIQRDTNKACNLFE